MWVIAIPSYKRAATLRDKTLTTLAKYKISPEKIHVFVANKAEYDDYKATLDPATYGHLRIGEKGMKEARNAITAHFKIGTPIFNMDDDITGFLEYTPRGKRHERQLPSLKAAIDRGFATLKKTGHGMFGFYPVANGYFMKPGYTTDLRYIIGSAWGIINPGLGALRITIDDKEDYLRSVIMYLHDGGVVRFNDIAPETKYYKEPGGMQEERSMSRISDSAKAMVEAFPDLVSINLTKKSGIPEVRLRDRRDTRKRGLAGYRLPTVRNTRKKVKG
jgi:hypothetical protein